MKSKIGITTIIQMVICMGILLIMPTACLKDCDLDHTETSKPELTTDTVSAITQTTAQSGGTITSDGGDTITARGVCWSITQLPTIEDSITSDSTGIGSFNSFITGLITDTTYYVRAYATNNVGIGYGNERTFTTASAPVLAALTTFQILDITQTTAISGGVITSDGGSLITAKGVCWSISVEPTTNDYKTSDGSGTGTFISDLTSLVAGTLYYVRAYATNNVGTGYGNQHTFTTQAVPVPPSLTTAVVTGITQSTATSGGNVTFDGGLPVTERGVCWSASPNPTTADSKTLDGSGTGTFISDLTGLVAGSLYYVRAYATNNAGTGYGNQQNFTTSGAPPCPGIPTITDPRDGQVYTTVQIGSQCWLQKNVNYETGNSWCYDNDPDNCTIYGRLYDWNTLMNGASSSNSVPSGVQGVCPSGWHVPSDNEWCILTQYIDPTVNCSSMNEWSGTDVGLKMKSTSGWYNNQNGNNASGFTALPGGLLNINGFWLLTEGTWFWSSTQHNSNVAFNRGLVSYKQNIYRYIRDRGDGLPARCVKD